MQEKQFHGLRAATHISCASHRSLQAASCLSVSAWLCGRELICSESSTSSAGGAMGAWGRHKGVLHTRKPSGVLAAPSSAL